MCPSDSCLPCCGLVSTDSLNAVRLSTPPSRLLASGSGSCEVSEDYPDTVASITEPSLAKTHRRFPWSSTTDDSNSPRFKPRRLFQRKRSVAAIRDFSSVLDLGHLPGDFSDEAYDPDAVAFTTFPSESITGVDDAGLYIDGHSEASGSRTRSGSDRDRSSRQTSFGQHQMIKGQDLAQHRSSLSTASRKRQRPPVAFSGAPHLELNQLNGSGLSINWLRTGRSSDDSARSSRLVTNTNLDITSEDTLSLPKMRISQHLRSTSAGGSSGEGNAAIHYDSVDAISSEMSPIIVSNAIVQADFDGVSDNCLNQDTGAEVPKQKPQLGETSKFASPKDSMSLATNVIKFSALPAKHITAVDGTSDDLELSPQPQHSVSANYDAAGHVWSKALNTHQKGLETKQSGPTPIARRLSAMLLREPQAKESQHAEDQEASRRPSIGFKPLSTEHSFDRLEIPGAASKRRSAIHAAGAPSFRERAKSIAATTIRSADSEESAWSRFPSHTRHEQNSSAGEKDGVTAKDFVFKEQGEDDESEVDPIKLTKTQKLFSRKAAWRRFSNALDDFVRPFSVGNRLGEKGHRSSIAAGGSLEYPDLELLAGRESRLAPKTVSKVPDFEPEAVQSAPPDSRRSRQARYASNMGSSEYLPSNENQISSADGNADTLPPEQRSLEEPAQAWASIYEDCVPDFSTFSSIGEAARSMLDGAADAPSLVFSQKPAAALSVPDLSSLTRGRKIRKDTKTRSLEGFRHSTQRLNALLDQSLPNDIARAIGAADKAFGADK